MAFSAFYLEMGVKTMQGVGELLHYKRDRRRRGDSMNGTGDEDEEQVVVKMNVLQIYSLTVSVRPGKDIKYMWVDGQKLELKSVQQHYIENEARKYKAQWTTTEYEPTKNGHRKRIAIEVEFTTGEFLKTEIYAKFYPANDRVHSRVGRMLSILSLLCHAPEGTFVNVVKKEFL